MIQFSIDIVFCLYIDNCQNISILNNSVLFKFTINVKKSSISNNSI